MQTFRYLGHHLEVIQEFECLYFVCQRQLCWFYNPLISAALILNQIYVCVNVILALKPATELC